MFGQAKATFLVSNPREQRICTIGEAFRVLKSRIFQASGDVSKTPISREGLGYGNGRINAESTNSKIATVAARPRESVNIVVIANPGDLRKIRTPNRTSWTTVSNHAPVRAA